MYYSIIIGFYIHSPRKIGRRFSLKAAKASRRSFVGSRVSYEARSKSNPVSRARSPERLTECLAALNAKGAAVNHCVSEFTLLTLQIRTHHFLQYFVLGLGLDRRQSIQDRKHS